MKISRTMISVVTRCGASGPDGDINGGDGRAAVARPEIDRLGAIEGGLPRTVAVVERPGAGGADRNRAGQAEGDRML